jgi:RNA-directed DNA polymerase
VFSGELLTRKGEPYTVKLMKASDVRIERHALIRHAANPYDPSGESYYEGRVQVKMRATLLGRETLRELCASQAGRSHRCNRRRRCPARPHY